MKVDEAVLAGLSCITLENEFLKIWITKEVGPRLLGLSFLGGDNLLAELPDAKIIQEGIIYSLRGGHRLWRAPEVPELTYIADDEPAEIIPEGNGLRIIQDIESETGIQKSWHVTLPENEASLELVHRITNRGSETLELAPWAITQFRPGGKALLPLQTEVDDSNRLQPNRSLVFWPYTDIESSHIKLGDKAICIEARLNEGAMKVGAPNTLGWIAYALDDTLFIKRAEYLNGANYADCGSSSQIYCNSEFIELETLGPLVNLEPGEFTEHIEIWQVYSEDQWPQGIEELF